MCLLMVLISVCYLYLYVFFFKQKTAYEMRISDWSSDVCSSDLTEPEVAWVGRTEQQLKEDGTPYKTGSFPFAAIGRAVAMADPAGFVKVIAHAETDRVLGLHLVGVGVAELVHEGVLTMAFKGSGASISRIIHAHPTLAECVQTRAVYTT